MILRFTGSGIRTKHYGMVNNIGKIVADLHRLFVHGRIDNYTVILPWDKTGTCFWIKNFKDLGNPTRVRCDMVDSQRFLISMAHLLLPGVHLFIRHPEVTPQVFHQYPEIHRNCGECPAKEAKCTMSPGERCCVSF